MRKECGDVLTEGIAIAQIVEGVVVVALEVAEHGGLHDWVGFVG